MAVVGHWENLAEAQKLVQSVLLEGVIETVIETGHLLSRIPVKQITGKDLLYNREDTWAAESGAGFFDIREQIPWSSDVSYTSKTTALTRIARQEPIDNFVRETYSDPNDYKALMIQQLTKRMTRFIEHMMIYGDNTFGGSKQFDGLHALAEETDDPNGELDIDENGPLAMINLRILLDAMHIDQEDPTEGDTGRGNVLILAPKVIARRIDAGYQEAGMVVASGAISSGQVQFGRNEHGARITFFDGIPIQRSGFMQAEQAGTGEGSNAKALRTSGTREYTIFVIRFGQTEDGGLSMLFGGSGMGEGVFMKNTSFDKLEDFDSGGERMVSYIAPVLGGIHSLGRIHGITDAVVTP